LLVADKEHFTQKLLALGNQYQDFDILIPAICNSKINKIIEALCYKPLWAGYAISETNFNFNGDDKQYRLIAQRVGEVEKDYLFSAFITTSNKDAKELICKDYDERWSVEEFFRFENEMGMNRASTLNLNIRYGKLALAMVAQGATYQLRNKLGNEYKKWDAKHLSNEILAWADGDVRVKEDTIIVTFYGNQKHLNVNDYVNLPMILQKEGINPKIPWLFNYKLDFRFK